MQNLKTFNMDRLKPLQGYSQVDESKLANVGLRLAEGRTLTLKARRSFEVLSKVYKTVQQLSRRPAPGEAIHCTLNGAYALFDFIPAIIELGDRQRIEQLKVATLGFSKKNVADLMALVDDGLVGDVSVLCSHYFSAADGHIYRYMVEQFHAHGFKVQAMRTHAKVLLMKQGGDYFTVESSANLRSCHNIEQATIINDRQLYQFHAQWIDEMIAQADKATTENQHARTSTDTDRDPTGQGEQTRPTPRKRAKTIPQGA